MYGYWSLYSFALCSTSVLSENSLKSRSILMWLFFSWFNVSLVAIYLWVFSRVLAKLVLMVSVCFLMFPWKDGFGAAYSTILPMLLGSLLLAHRYQTVGAVSPAWISLARKAGTLLLCAGQNLHVLWLVWSRGGFSSSRVRWFKGFESDS